MRRRVVGIDEVGTGTIAGPAVVAACAFEWEEYEKPEWLFEVTDSKRLNGDKIEQLSYLLRQHPKVRYWVESIDAKLIDYLGLSRCMSIVVQKLVRIANEALGPSRVIIDGSLSYGVCLAIPKADLNVPVVSAASILATDVHRKAMYQLEVQTGFRFSQHHGYATTQHLKELERWGPTRYHRRLSPKIRTRIAGASATNRR